MLRHLIFGKNIITSYFKAKLVLAAPGSGIYLLQNFTFVYLFNKLLLTVTYLLYFAPVLMRPNCTFLFRYDDSGDDIVAAPLAFEPPQVILFVEQPVST